MCSSVVTIEIISYQTITLPFEYIHSSNNYLLGIPNLSKTNSRACVHNVAAIEIISFLTIKLPLEYIHSRNNCTSLFSLFHPVWIRMHTHRKQLVMMWIFDVIAIVTVAMITTVVVAIVNISHFCIFFIVFMVQGRWRIW